MNKITDFFQILSCLAILFSACTDSGSKEITTWEKTFGEEKRSEEIIQTKSGNFVLGGFENLQLLDENGNELWQTNLTEQIPGTFRTFVYELLESNEGDIIVIAGVSIAERVSLQPVFLKINKAGNIEILKFLLDKNYCGDTDLVEKNGDYEFIFSTCAENENSTLYSLEIDNEGNIIQEKNFVFSNATESFPGPFLILPNETGFIIVSERKHSEPFEIKKLDNDMNEVWSTLFGEPVFSELHDVVQTQDGGYLAAGDIQGIYGWVVKFDSNGTLVWEKKYDTESPGKSFLFDMIDDPNGGFTMVGYTNRNSAGSEDAWITRINNTGDLVWDLRYGEEFGDFFWGIIATSDGGYAVVGEKGISFEYPQYKLWILKLNDNGKL